MRTIVASILLLISMNANAFFFPMWDSMMSSMVPGYGPPTHWSGWAYVGPVQYEMYQSEKEYKIKPIGRCAYGKGCVAITEANVVKANVVEEKR